MSADLGTVEDQSFILSNFRLQNGTVVGEAKIAYESYGRLAADGKNAVLITHGYTSSHHAAGRSPANGNLGHSASGSEDAKWPPVLREFLGPLMETLN